ncbi:Stk1 family PASTA domain-containing Ser/Thr kinase [Blastococcus atacamensis]|uniref:Stk1 family PASTA domain-containing Ser/Thr kinase n=1 Tax=Blastococcus atacamensis TaxID=2070508 RepID=UPI000CEBBE90|nr:Stk1 family PASTA domain-containing Ser/Thr kinase [Blastococcus atacamensis]
MTTPQVLGERYEIGGVLGRGGMAEVHHGRDLRLGREVAVKVLRSDLARDPSFQVRFRREAQASASLNHPAIVAVYDTGEDRTPAGATPYIVMEFVEGETLRDVLRREGHLPIERAMSLAADICGALDFSHRNGIVHRDVKPGNVMITPQGTVKVMDFGIARAVSDSAATMTSTAAVIGTAQYLSPEQARGEGVDARSDVYSMGCLLYELVTGAPPFTGDSPVSVAYQHVREDPRLPSSINREVPPELDAILLKAMSKNPANRYQSAADMRNDLLRALAGQRVEATPVMGEDEKTAIIGAPVGGYGNYGDEWDDDDQARRRKRRIIAIVSVLALLLIGGAVALAVSLGAEDETPTVDQVAVPTLVNLTEPEARTAIEGAGLAVDEVTQEASTTVPEGRVIESTPAAGARVDEGSEVDLVVSSGPDTLTIPGVEGLTEEQARANLEAAGFTNVGRRPVESVDVDEGRVVSVDPAEGTQAGRNQVITLNVSTGTVEMPDVVNQTEQQARAALQDLGIGAGQIEVQNAENDSVPQGTVLETDPQAGTDVGGDDIITLVVAVPTPPDEPATPTTTTTTTPPAAPPATGGGGTGTGTGTDTDNDPLTPQ